MSLRGARIALLESRLESELAALVRRQGGDPVCTPALREAPVEDGLEVAAFIDRLARGSCQMAVFLTGVGAKLLLDAAERIGRLPELVAALREMTTIARGPKPAAPLSRYGVRPSVIVGEPYTTTELLAAISGFDLAGKNVAVVHYGERNEPLVDGLQARGARLDEIQLYRWLLPEDLEPLRHLVREIIGGRLDAVAFTTQIQVRHLFEVAQKIGLAGELTRALADATVVASIGPTCSAVLRGFGVTPQVEPVHPKMRPLITALADYLEQTNASKPKNRYPGES